MKILGKNDLLSAENLRRELVPIPSLDASVWMRELSAEHVVDFKNRISKLRAEGVKETTLEQDIEIMTIVISMSACDEHGNLLFSSPDEAKGLTQNNINVLLDLGNKALEISKIKVSSNGLTSEVAADLPKDQATSLLGNSPKSSKHRARRS